MKRCPECRRDYYDDTLLYCLDDGNALLEGPANGEAKSGPPASGGGQFDDGPATAILLDSDSPAEAPTRAQIQSMGQTAVPPTGMGQIIPKPGGFDKRLLAAPILVVIISVGVYFGYRYFASTSSQIESIAVLPFENPSGSGDTEYLSDGLADSLIYRLSQLPNLKVSPTSSVMRYRQGRRHIADRKGA